MSNTTFTTTEQSALEAIEKHATPLYSRFGFRSAQKERMVKALTDPAMAQREYEEDGMDQPTIAATKIRNTLWSFGGGTTSASVACEIMKELGRKDEVGYLAEEGHVRW